MPTKRLIDWFDDPGDERYELRLQYPNAKEILIDFLDWRLAGHVLWLPWYKELVEWLTDNEGKGLVLYGPPYVGKSVIAHDFIPKLLRTTRDLIIHALPATALNSAERLRSNELYMRQFMKILLDVGKESIINEYGIRYWGLNKVVDDAITHNKFVVITTSLTPEQLAMRYGNDTLHNLIELCKFIECKPRDA